MEKQVLCRKRPAGQKNSIPVSWDHDRTVSEENQMIEGVGRAGASIQSLNAAGVSNRSMDQTRELGTTRLRISRPGGCEIPKHTK